MTNLVVQAEIEAAETGDPEAQYQLGLIFYSGIGVSSAHQRAWNWFKLADAKDHKMASYYLGRICAAQGKHEAGLDWFHRSGELGFHSALARIGLCYLRGHGVSKNSQLAYEYFRNAGEAGNIRAEIICCRMQAIGQLGISRIPAGFCELFRLMKRLVTVDWTGEVKNENHERMMI